MAGSELVELLLAFSIGSVAGGSKVEELARVENISSCIFNTGDVCSGLPLRFESMGSSACSTPREIAVDNFLIALELSEWSSSTFPGGSI